MSNLRLSERAYQHMDAYEHTQALHMHTGTGVSCVQSEVLQHITIKTARKSSYY